MCVKSGIVDRVENVPWQRSARARGHPQKVLAESWPPSTSRHPVLANAANQHPLSRARPIVIRHWFPLPRIRRQSVQTPNPLKFDRPSLAALINPIDRNYSCVLWWSCCARRNWISTGVTSIDRAEGDFSLSILFSLSFFFFFYPLSVPCCGWHMYQSSAE